MAKCNYLILQCMDYRIQHPIMDWIRKRGYLKDIDVISFGGSCKLKDFALQNIEICREKHGIKQVFLTQHDDCAAYGGYAAFPSLEAEGEKLIADTVDLKKRIGERHPEVSVTMLYIQEDGDSWKIVEVK